MDVQLAEASMGTRVPSVAAMAICKYEPDGDVNMSVEGGQDEISVRPQEIDRDFLCPICMQTIKDAFLTSCGHSFCYTCITMHLQNKRNCPWCSQFLTQEQLFPNFLLNKLLKKATGAVLVSNASPTEHLRLALQQGQEMPVKELDLLLQLLAEKKRKAEQEEAESNMEILLDFLQRARQLKQQELKELQSDLQFLREDISVVESRKKELLSLKERSAVKLRGLLECAVGPLNEPVERRDDDMAGKPQGLESREDCRRHQSSEDVGPSEPASLAAAVTTAKKRRVLSQFDDLQEVYLQKRRRKAALARLKKMELAGSGGGNIKLSGLEDFQNILSAFTRFSRLHMIAELRHGDLFHSSNIVSSIEFDRDDELFATAGVSRRIKVFEFLTVVNESDVHCPVVEMSTRSKLSCLSWNKYIKSHIASSDYEGIVTVWDVNTCQSVMEYEEHEKRAWSVDFSRTEPTQLVSGSDDGKVKLWCMRQEASVVNIDMKANICCVKFNPGFSHFVAVGSADHHIHYYDLRNTTQPLHVFSGHRKAVSYVKFLSSTELASASTDSTLRLWDVQENCLLRTMKGHTNEKNFVGLSVNSDYIACGSETNEVYVFYKAMSKPAAVHRFGSSARVSEESDDDSSHFISAVCWKSESPTLLAANSQGTVQALTLRA
eukprot:TRINITY_DN20054_c0_g1_i1.p1 TRINITY_DN20054_c0_g1~~TRINITY_DN20054_c0_g1_i1.p1  ORF type:complete len:662 (+),score=133.07 TRINITY_DN20054_c0_g1_i1:215-2200(+)